MVNLGLEKIADDYFNERNLFEAEKLYMRVLAQDKTNRNALYKLAYINVGKLDYSTAEMLLDGALKIGADLKTLMLAAYVKEKVFKLYDAIVMYEKALEFEPSEGLYVIIGNLYIQLELYDNAIHIAEEYVQKFPTIMAYRRLFLIYLNLSKKQQLTELCEEIKQKFPNKGLAFNLLGMYKEFVDKDYAEAVKLYEKAVKLGVPTASFDLALCYKRMKKYDEAEKSCKKILDTYPRKNDVLNLLKDIYLREKKMRKGYKYYLERDLNKDIESLKNKWDGKESGGTVLVIADSIYPEVLRNLRYLKPLENKFKNVILACSPFAESLFSFNKIKTVSASDINTVKYDKYTLISELPYYLNMTFEQIPKFSLKSDKVDLGDGFKIGLLWKPQGDSLKAVNEQTIDTKYFKDLFEIENVQFYSFQKNDIFNTIETYPQIKDLSLELNTLEDYAKYVNSMDLIISIDSEVLHLAGCLNIPAMAILPFDAEWYWFENQNKTEWYPSIELFRQHLGEDWTGIINQIIEKVKVMANK